MAKNIRKLKLPKNYMMITKQQNKLSKKLNLNMRKMLIKLLRLLSHYYQKSVKLMLKLQELNLEMMIV